MARILSRLAGLSLVKSTPLGVLGVGNYRDEVEKNRGRNEEGAHRVPALEMSHISTLGPISSWRNEESQKI
jgi:hypothetical protein